MKGHGFFFAWLFCGITEIAFAQMPNTAEMLGYSPQDKLLIINADDFGMCHAENVATIELLKGGHISSATMMVPCPWVKEAVAFCLKHPEVNVGIHTTFTSEWKYYKWGSVAPSSQVLSLLTPEGYFPSGVQTVETNARPEEIEIEMRAQIEKALAFGIKPTHFDNHMGSVYGLLTGRHFFDVVFKLSAEYNLPFRLPRNLSDRYLQVLPQAVIQQMQQKSKEIIAKGYVLPDYLETVEHGKNFDETALAYQTLLSQLKPGVTELYIHAALPTEEMKAISGAWKNREMDYQFFQSPETREFLTKQEIKMISYRELRTLQMKRMGR